MVRNYLDYAGLKRVIGKLFGVRRIWHGTQAEWDALTPAERDYYDQAEVIDAGEESYQYTTEEVYTGKKWIDGKKIYRRVLLCTTATQLNPTSGWINTPGWSVVIPNIKQYIKIDFSGNNYGGRIDHWHDNDKLLKFCCSFSTITVGVGEHMIVEYTKITD